MTNLRIIIKEPWNTCECYIKQIAEDEIDLSKPTKKQLDILNFLRAIQMIEKFGIKLTENGKKYYTSKHVQSNNDLSSKVLSECVKQHPATQLICQLLWGRPNIKRSNILSLLKFEKIINSKFKEVELRGFLMLLNHTGIIDYSKKYHTIKVLYNPKGIGEPIPNEIFLSPETPYGNVINLKKLIRECKEEIKWFDKNFGVKGLEILYDEVDGNEIKNILILTSNDQNVNSRMKSEYERFEKEMKTRNVKTELRVIVDKNEVVDIHDRWIISKNVCYNLPPVNSIFQNQYAEITKTSNEPPFDKWWSKGIPLIEKFTDIMNSKVN